MLDDFISIFFFLQRIRLSEIEMYGRNFFYAKTARIITLAASCVYFCNGDLINLIYTYTEHILKHSIYSEQTIKSLSHYFCTHTIFFLNFKLFYNCFHLFLSILKEHDTTDKNFNL